MALDDWRIDAWAVRDGAAFASRRKADSREAENTVFIAVPDLEPVPVGRLSTALSATRRNFQTGLRNNEGVEIAFESLEQIAELVRRGFLAAGLGPGGSAAPTPGGRLPPGGDIEQGEAPVERDRPPGGGGEYYEQLVKRSDAYDWMWTKGSHPGERLEEIAAAAASPRTDSKDSGLVRPLWKLMLAYAEAITIDWEWRLEQRLDPLDMKMLVDWYAALWEIGVWMDGKQMHGFLDRHRTNVGRNLWEHFWNRAEPVGPSANEVAGLPRQHLLAYAPCPRRSDWTKGLRRFADKVTLPMCIGTYFEENPHLPELAPSILGATLLTSGGFPSAIVTRTQFTGSRLATALRWLAREIPGIALPRDAESLVRDYAWNQVGDPSPDGEPGQLTPQARY